jgi:hypothetical protein
MAWVGRPGTLKRRSRWGGNGSESRFHRFRSQGVAELLIDCEEEPDAPAVLVGMWRDADR